MSIAINDSLKTQHAKPVIETELKLASGGWVSYASFEDLNEIVQPFFQKNKYFWVAGKYYFCNQNGEFIQLTLHNELATVASSGSYTDLVNIPGEPNFVVKTLTTDTIPPEVEEGEIVSYIVVSPGTYSHFPDKGQQPVVVSVNNANLSETRTLGIMTWDGTKAFYAPLPLTIEGITYLQNSEGFTILNPTVADHLFKVDKESLSFNGNSVLTLNTDTFSVATSGSTLSSSDELSFIAADGTTLKLSKDLFDIVVGSNEIVKYDPLDPKFKINTTLYLNAPTTEPAITMRLGKSVDQSTLIAGSLYYDGFNLLFTDQNKTVQKFTVNGVMSVNSIGADANGNVVISAESLKVDRGIRSLSIAQTPDAPAYQSFNLYYLSEVGTYTKVRRSNLPSDYVVVTKYPKIITWNGTYATDEKEIITESDIFSVQDGLLNFTSSTLVDTPLLSIDASTGLARIGSDASNYLSISNGSFDIYQYNGSALIQTFKIDPLNKNLKIGLDDVGAYAQISQSGTSDPTLNIFLNKVGTAGSPALYLNNSGLTLLVPSLGMHGSGINFDVTGNNLRWQSSNGSIGYFDVNAGSIQYSNTVDYFQINTGVQYNGPSSSTLRVSASQCELSTGNYGFFGFPSSATTTYYTVVQSPSTNITGSLTAANSLFKVDDGLMTLTSSALVDTNLLTLDYTNSVYRFGYNENNYLGYSEGIFRIQNNGEDYIYWDINDNSFSGYFGTSNSKIQISEDSIMSTIKSVSGSEYFLTGFQIQENIIAISSSSMDSLYDVNHYNSSLLVASNQIQLGYADLESGVNNLLMVDNNTITFISEVSTFSNAFIITPGVFQFALVQKPSGQTISNLSITASGITLPKLVAGSLSQAPLVFQAGTTQSVSVPGAINYDGTYLYLTIDNGTTSVLIDSQTFTNSLTNGDIANSAILGSLSLTNSSTVTSTDTITAAIGKLQAQINSLQTQVDNALMVS